MDVWNGFACKTITFEEKQAKIVFPQNGTANGKLMLKTEYWNAFPEAIEIPLLNKGYHLCFIENQNRWGIDDDLDRKARFVRYIQKEYQLNNGCVPIGMSCGGLIAIKFAAKYPELASCLYLDAPVVNYMSCPCGFGVGQPLAENNDEILKALSLNSISELLAYREMPLDNIPTLVEHEIPICMVYGDSDLVVPYYENGIWLQKAYEDKGLPFEVHMKRGCGHHPHGLEDSDSIVRFIEEMTDI